MQLKDAQNNAYCDIRPLKEARYFLFDMLQSATVVFAPVILPKHRISYRVNKDVMRFCRYFERSIPKVLFWNVQTGACVSYSEILRRAKRDREIHSTETVV